MIRRRAVALLAGLAAALVAAAGCTGSSGGSGSGAGSAQAPTRTGAAGGWGLPADMSAAAARAGLPMLGQEELAVHYHAHVDLLINGQRVPVPAGLGIDTVRQRISPLHTHDATGVIHIESAHDIPFTLGQLFTEWGQPLSSTRVGPVAVGGGQVLRLYRDGRVVTGDPAALVFRPHLEIAIWVGARSSTPQVPSTYAFPTGL